MLTPAECDEYAAECARRAANAELPELVARYRHLERSWLYLARLKAQRTGALPALTLATSSLLLLQNALRG
jgi:hypothetical protein